MTQALIQHYTAHHISLKMQEPIKNLPEITKKLLMDNILPKTR